MQNQLAEIKSFTEGEIATMRDTIAKGTTPSQFALFIRTAEASGLNPLLNHMHCIVYNGKDGPTMSIQIAVEGILHLARKTEGYKGIDTQLVHENDEFKMGRNEQGKIVIKEHDWGANRGNVVGGYSIAKREGFDDVIVYMEVNEVDHMKKGRNANMWKDWFNDMFKKHISKRAAKLQYGIEIAEDEAIPSTAQQTGNYEPRTRKDITPDVTSEPEQVVQDERTKEDKMTELKQQMKEKFKTLGLTTKKAMADYIDTHLPDAGDDPSVSELVALLEIMDMDIERRQFEEMQDLPE